jgi:hypothetical protein
MSVSAAGEIDVGKKKSSKGPVKRYGTLVRVTDRTAEILRRVSRQEDISVAEFMTRYVEPIAEKRYGELIAKEMERLKGRKGAKGE